MDTRLNETMRILTVATLSLTIPTMLAGVFGMNVDFPFNQHTPYVFWTIIIISVVGATLISYYFLKKR
jgi:magnesium transporter